jgi:hypothetical protein
MPDDTLVGGDLDEDCAEESDDCEGGERGVNNRATVQDRGKAFVKVEWGCMLELKPFLFGGVPFEGRAGELALYIFVGREHCSVVDED